MNTAIINWNSNVPKIAIVFDSNNQFTFFDQLLHNELRDFGIYIPEGLRDQYENKKYVTLPDPIKSNTPAIKQFRKAFDEIYFPQHLQNHKFTKSIVQR